MRQNFDLRAKKPAHLHRFSEDFPGLCLTGAVFGAIVLASEGQNYRSTFAERDVLPGSLQRSTTSSLLRVFRRLASFSRLLISVGSMAFHPFYNGLGGIDWDTRPTNAPRVSFDCLWRARRWLARLAPPGKRTALRNRYRRQTRGVSPVPRPRWQRGCS